MSQIYTRPATTLPPAIAFARFVHALTVAERDGYHVAPLLTEQFDWRATPQVHAAIAMVTKAAISPGTTTDPTWAAPLAESGIAKEAITFMRGVGILGQLEGRVRSVPFNLKVPRETSDIAVGDWIPEGVPTQFVALAFDTVGPLTRTKIGAAVGLTTELVTAGGPASESFVRDAALGALGKKIDQLLLDPLAAAASGRPASITNGAVEIASSGATAAAIMTDLNAMLAAITTSASGLVWILKRPTMAHIAGALGATSGLPGSLLGLPVIAHANSPQQITLVDAPNVLVADDSEFDVTVSVHSTPQMDSAPAYPAAATTVFTSLWQNNLAAIKSMRWINWLRARDGAVSYMAVTY